MTNQERAEKIANNWVNHPYNVASLTDEITSQLDEAVREAIQFGLDSGKEARQEFYAEGFAAARAQEHCCCDETKQCVKDAVELTWAAAREKAAEIAEGEPCTHCDICPKMIGRMIRSLTPGDKVEEK